jgi:SPP1 family phage portal protein
MLTTEEIKMFIDEDTASVKKSFARVGERYFDGDHDILKYRMFYYNSDGQLVEDKTRSNVKIPHPFFKELTEQGTQYTLSGDEPFVLSDIPELQEELDNRFNYNDDFIDELSEVITDCQAKGFAYMYAMKDSTDTMKFTCADSIGVVEVEARFADDKKDHVLYWYVDRIDKEGHRIKKIMDWDDEQVYYYVQSDEGEIETDTSVEINPRPHTLYQIEGDEKTYYESLGFIPFFRLDNNKKQTSNLKAVKALIDDYDLMASSLSNNLIDFDHPLYAVKGFEGDNLDELQQNLKTKKIVGVGSDGGIDVHTVDVPFEARKTKLDLDEKNIYRFGMGLNLSGLKDTSATTNIAIKAAYSLLDLRCKHLERNIKRFLRKIVKVVIDEINQQNDTGYQPEDVYFKFTHEVMSNEQENKQNELTEAQRKQVEVNILLGLANVFDQETIIQAICEILDIDYEEIKDKLPDDEAGETGQAQQTLGDVIPDDEGGGAGEQGTESGAAGAA